MNTTEVGDVVTAPNVVAANALIATRNRLTRNAQILFPRLIANGAALFPDRDIWVDRKCAYFHARPADMAASSEFAVCFLLGGPGGNWSKRERYHVNVMEKAMRLEAHIEDGHLTSFESRDPEKSQFQGSILMAMDGVEWLLSLSGLIEQADESFNLILSAVHNPGDPQMEKRISEIVRRTRNALFEPLRIGAIGLRRP